MPDLLIQEENIALSIYQIRGQKVMLDRDLAKLYGVETRTLKQAVKRNIKRFPPDFMFELKKEEFENWRSQFVTSNSDRMGLRYAPFAFTEQGVAMLSSVLNSDRAIEVNIAIMRTFVKLRKAIMDSDEIRQRLDEHDDKIQLIINAINKILKGDNQNPSRKQ
jgi:tetrahydromethanopterin S-methyltransferase subunit G